MDSPELRAKYRRSIRLKVLFILACVVLSVIALGSSVVVGGKTVNIVEVYTALFDHIRGIRYEQYTEKWYRDVAVWNLRVPRAIFAVIAGAGLAIAGAAMQSVMKNPLADAYTTGVSSGACFGVAVSAAFGFAAVGSSSMFNAINAFVFSLIPTIFIIYMAPRQNMTPATLILAGQAITYLFNSLTTVLLSILDEVSLANVYEWEIGTFKYITWDDVMVPFVVTLFGSTILILLSKKLNVMSLGDEQATALGLNIETLRIILLFIVTFIVASIVAYAGIIGFVGLVAPHIVRMILGGDNRFVIPASAAFGATFLLVCDMIARYLSPMETIPVGIVISFIGAPLFLYFIIRQRRSMW